MTSTIRQRRYKRTSANDEYGNKAAILDRRKRALALRAQGHSYRSIAEEMGVDVRVAWMDTNLALEQFADETSAEAVKVELLQILRDATGTLVSDIQQQQRQGQVETIRQPDGSIVTKVKAWVNVQAVSELGRTCSRIAQLMGIQDGSVDDQGSASFSSTNITLISPGDPAQFAQRSQELAAARQDAAITVEATPEAAQSEPEADPQPEPLQDASEPLLGPDGQPLTGWRLSRARRLAEQAQGAERPSATDAPPAQPKPRGRAARGRSGAYQQRVLPAPVRN